MNRAARRLGSLCAASLLLVLQSPALVPLDQGGLELDRAVPGVPGSTLREVFGEPIAVVQGPAAGVRREEFARPDRGYGRVTVWLGQRGQVTCARVRPVRPLRLPAAELLFDLRGASERSPGHLFSGAEPGLTESYPREGVHFFLLDDRVVEIWRSLPEVDAAALGVGLGVAYPPATLPEPTPEPALAAPVAPEVEIPNGLLRGLAVVKLDVALELDERFNPVLVATAEVTADGLADQEIQFEGYLRPLALGTETPPRLAAGSRAPAEFRDDDGSFHVTASTTVLYDAARFSSAYLRLPLSHLADFHGDFSGEFLATFEVTCADLASVGTVICAVPGPLNEPAVALPELRGGAVLVVPGELDGFGEGLWIYRDVEALNLRDHNVWSYITLRTGADEPVRAAVGWDDWRAKDGSFYAASSDTVLYGDSKWEPFRIFVPYGGLALEPGVHRVVLRSQVNVSNLGGAHELELDLTIPEGSR